MDKELEELKEDVRIFLQQAYKDAELDETIEWSSAQDLLDRIIKICSNQVG